MSGSAKRSRLVASVAAAAVVMVAGGSPSDARAAELRLSPTADSSIFFDRAGSGNFDAVSDSLGESLWTSVTMSGVVRRALIQFDLSEVPAGQRVVAASLDLYLERAQGSHDVSLHRVLTAWGEGGSRSASGLGAPATAGDPTWTWADYLDRRWDTPGGDFVSTPSAVTFVDDEARSYRWASPELLADVQGWLGDPAGNHGWILVGREDLERNAFRFSSREGFVPPRLTLQLAPIPEPGTLLMLATGMAVIAWRRYRGNRSAA